MSAKPPFDLDSPHSGGDNRPLPNDAETGDEIDEMFDTALSRAPDSEFLESIHTWWEEKGFLTSKQYEALCKFAGEEE